MKKLRVGVIGLGMGRHHIAGYQGTPPPRWWPSRTRTRRGWRRSATKYGIATRYTYAEEMLEREKLDIVSVATPNKFHKPLTLAALQGGLPRAVREADGDERRGRPRR